MCSVRRLFIKLGTNEATLVASPACPHCMCRGGRTEEGAVVGDDVLQHGDGAQLVLARRAIPDEGCNQHAISTAEMARCWFSRGAPNVMRSTKVCSRAANVGLDVSAQPTRVEACPEIFERVNSAIVRLSAR